MTNELLSNDGSFSFSAKISRSKEVGTLVPEVTILYTLRNHLKKMTNLC